jgi:signal transduction histidine kinase
MAAIIFVVMFTVLPAGFVFYANASRTLTEVRRKEIQSQLEQLQRNLNEQIKAIDSLNTHLISNSVIYGSLDPAAVGYSQKSAAERHLEVERQLSLMMVNTYLWDEDMLNGVYIFNNEGENMSFSTEGTANLPYVNMAYSAADIDEPSLQIIRPGVGPVYFIRNIKSMYNGSQIAVIAIDIEEREWKDKYSAGLGDGWTTLLYSGGELISGPESAPEGETEAVIEAVTRAPHMLEQRIAGRDYFIASHDTRAAGLVSVVYAQREQLFAELDDTLRQLIVLYIAVILMLTAFGAMFGYAVTSHIKKMIAYVRDISRSQACAKRPEGMIEEFDEFASAFTEMLEKLDEYYNDLFNQRLLLKNAEISALQAQISPHFLFNVLNTIAWKAEMVGNDEIYRMTIAISELLQTNVLSKDKELVTLDEELSYVRLYIYLQQKRFEDKIEAAINTEGVDGSFKLPRFCIQPLVENAIRHGLEPLTEHGRLRVDITRSGDGALSVRVSDNGGGFPEHFVLEDIQPAREDGHTRVGLNNLNKRLILLYGSESALRISREADMTVVSFVLPAERN